MSQDIYRQLQQHLDKQPIGFPKTKSGVEIRILKRIFTPTHARIALAMDYTHVTSTKILEQLGAESGYTLSELDEELSAMAHAGAIFYKEIGIEEREYALVPFIIGMYEFQLKSLSKEFLEDSLQYFIEKFAFEYLMPHNPQFRVLPIQKSIKVKNHVETYENLMNLIQETKDPIVVVPCVCRSAKDIVGTGCKKTTRREVCLTFRDIARYAINENLGREISKEEALEIARQSEKDGLMLEASGEQEAQIICACCSCCCGVVTGLNTLKRPADFVLSNFTAKLNQDACTYCGACVKKCNMKAITLNREMKSIELSEGRCIGCGVCVPACKQGAIELLNKPKKAIPPVTTEEMMHENMRNKKGKFKRAVAAVQIVAGIKKT